MPSSSEYKTIKATQVRIAVERFYVLLEDGRELGIPYDWYWRLAEATPEQLNNWRLIAGGRFSIFGGFYLLKEQANIGRLPRANALKLGG